MITTISSIVIEVIGGNFFFMKKFHIQKKQISKQKETAFFIRTKNYISKQKGDSIFVQKSTKKIHKQTKRDGIFLFAQKSIKTT